MHSLGTIVRIGIIAAAVTTAAGAQPGANNANTVAQQMVSRVQKAWASGDAAAYANLFAPDARIITRSGGSLEGQAAIRQFYGQMWSGPLKGVRWSGQVVSARPLGAGHLLVETTSEARGYRTPPPGAIETSPGVLGSRGTMVLARQGNDWRIISSQVTAVVPAQQSAARTR